MPALDAAAEDAVRAAFDTHAWALSTVDPDPPDEGVCWERALHTRRLAHLLGPLTRKAARCVDRQRGRRMFEALRRVGWWADGLPHPKVCEAPF